MAKNMLTNGYLDLMKQHWPETHQKAFKPFISINHIQDYTEVCIEKIAAGFNLQKVEYRLMSYIFRSGPPYQVFSSELVKQLMLGADTLYAILHSLQQRRLVLLDASMSQTMAYVALTDEGVILMQSAFSEVTRHHESLLSSLTPAEQDELHALLNKLFTTLEPAGL